MRFLGRHTSRLCVCAVLAMFGGILLWVQGSAAPWVYRSTCMPAFAPGFTLCFLLWLVVYGLAGLGLGILLLPPCFREAGGLRYSALCLLAYMMTLAWYPLFFSFWHSLLAAAVLGCGVVIHMYLLWKLGRRWMLAVPIFGILSVMEVYFVIMTVAYVLIN